MDVLSILVIEYWCTSVYEEVGDYQYVIGVADRDLIRMEAYDTVVRGKDQCTISTHACRILAVDLS